MNSSTWAHTDIYVLPLRRDRYMKYVYLSNYLLKKNYKVESIQVLTALSNVFILNSLTHAYYLLYEYNIYH